jgi:hypothetical protein
MKTLKLECTNCNRHFDLALKEHKRQIAHGRIEFFCSRSCAASKNNKDHPRPGNPDNLVADNRKDEYTQFRYFVNRGLYRSKIKKRYDCDLTVEYLKRLWDDQNGICPLTGWELILPTNSSYPWNESNPANASIDRIDNSKGYVQGNIRFVAYIANIARATFTDDQLKEFCKAVVNKS